MTTRTVTECNWCGREDVVGSIAKNNGDTYDWCSRHEAAVRAMLGGEQDAIYERTTTIALSHREEVKS